LQLAKLLANCPPIGENLRQPAMRCSARSVPQYPPVQAFNLGARNQIMLTSTPLRGPLDRRWPHRLPANRRLPAIYRLAGESPSDARPSDPMARDAALAMLEAVLFAADEPLPIRKLVQVAGLPDAATARRLLQRLRALYDAEGTAFQIDELAGGYQLLTRTEYHRWLARLRRGGAEVRIGPAARETLAIVAYRQPIMRADIEAIRGVHCSDTLALLMERGLVRIAGRDHSLGRPVLYGTTKRFLQLFGLRSLKDLPQSEKYRPPEKTSHEPPPAADAEGS
jgi:segregation and condensation protein B